MTRRIAIVGEGVEGWIVAAALVRAFGGSQTITIVPSAVIEPVACATDAAFAGFMTLIGLPIAQVVAAARGTRRIGTRIFREGTRPSAFVPGIEAVPDVDRIPLHHYLSTDGAPTVSAEDYAAIVEASAGAADHAGFHLESDGLRRLIADRTAAQGVARADGRIAAVHRDATTGAITGIAMTSGDSLHADLFIDASGTQRLLQTHPSPPQPEPSPDIGGMEPSTAATANANATVLQRHENGWRLRIPLAGADAVRDVAVDQHRAETARASWQHNCLAIGAAAGGIDAGDGAAMARLQKGVTQLIQLFPAGSPPAPPLVQEYNRRLQSLHDWHAAALALATDHAPLPPPALMTERMRRRCALFVAAGVLTAEDDDPLPASAWVSLLMGHGESPRVAHPLTGLRADRLAPCPTAATQRGETTPPHGSHRHGGPGE